MTAIHATQQRELSLDSSPGLLPGWDVKPDFVHRVLERPLCRPLETLPRGALRCPFETLPRASGSNLPTSRSVGSGCDSPPSTPPAVEGIKPQTEGRQLPARMSSLVAQPPRRPTNRVVNLVLPNRIPIRGQTKIWDPQQIRLLTTTFCEGIARQSIRRRGPWATSLGLWSGPRTTLPGKP